MPPTCCTLFQSLSLLLEQSAVTSKKPAHQTLVLHALPTILYPRFLCLPSFPGAVTRLAFSCHLGLSVNIASSGPQVTLPNHQLYFRQSPSRLDISLFSCSCLSMACTPLPPCPLQEQGPACFSSVPTTEPGTQGALNKLSE